LHGDAKGANILFSPSGQCAFVDFQYVGGGPPTLDLVYFLGTSIESRLIRGDGEEKLLRFYWDALQENFSQQSHPPQYGWDTFRRQWEFALVDWCRFMAGWGFWGNDDWISRRAREVVRRWEAHGWD
jgi:thiamine kinase-like enzyme